MRASRLPALRREPCAGRPTPSRLERAARRARVPWAIACIYAAFAPDASRAGISLGAELFAGAPWNVPLPLRIDQSGFPALRFSARYETRPFELPFYYRIRAVMRTGDGDEWALELVHHKLYLENGPPEVGFFSVSHGYNLLLASRGWDVGPAWVRFGAGAVIAHPESRVRDRTLDEHAGILRWGYYLSGGAVAVMVERRVSLLGPVHASVGTMVTAAFARVPVRDGDANVPNVAFHVLAGLGIMPRAR